MATCEWCGGTGWGEARPKVGLADKWLRVPCPNPECVYRAEDPHDPRVEAAARAMSGITHWPPDDAAEAALFREQAREGLAAADAVDPLRDRGRAVPIIEQALAAWWAVPGPLEPGRDLAEAVFDALNGGGE